MAKGDLVILLHPRGVCPNPLFRFGIILLSFFAFRTILVPNGRWLQAPSRRSWLRGAWPGRGEGVAWAGKAECLCPGLPPLGNRGLRPKLLFQLTIGQLARDADA